MEQQIVPQGQYSALPAGYQVPAGFALFPVPNQPPPEFQFPAGYALVLQSQDVPPSYSEANKM